MAKSLGPPAAGNSFVEFDASAFDKAAALFGRHWDGEASQMITDAMQRSAEVIQRAVVKQALPHRRTGLLERQIKIVRPTGTGFGQQIRVKSGGQIAHLVSGPVRAHEIRAFKNEHPLPLSYGKIGLTIGFAENVQHPFTRGDPYFARGVKNARLAVNNVLQAAIRRLARHLAEILKEVT